MRIQWEINTSKIHGNGIFLLESAPANALIGCTGRYVDGEYHPTKLGIHHNHSYQPNTLSIKVDDMRFLVTTKALISGSEVTVDYTQQPDLEQPAPLWT
jgi:hypothetical protein